MKGKIIVNKPYTIYIINDIKAGRKFKGIAKCDKYDTWEEEKGIKIAKLKAEINRLNWKKRKLSSLKKFIINFINNEILQIDKKIGNINSEVDTKIEVLLDMINIGS